MNKQELKEFINSDLYRLEGKYDIKSKIKNRPYLSCGCIMRENRSEYLLITGGYRYGVVLWSVA